VSKVRRALAHLPLLPRALGLVWSGARGWTAVWALLLLVQGILPVAAVYLTRALVDSLVTAVEGGGSWETIRGPLALALLMAGLMLVGELLRSVTGWVRTAQAELVGDHIRGLIHDRATAADLAFFDSPEYHDQLFRVRIDAHHRPVALVESLGLLLQNGLTLIAMAAVLVSYGWWVPVVLVASTLPALFVVGRFALREHDWWVRTTTESRRAWYYDWLLTSRETAAELRLLGLGTHFRGLFGGLREGLRRGRISLGKEEALAAMAAGGVALLVLGGAVAFMVVQALRGAMTLGGLAMFYQAFSQGQRLIRSLLDSAGQVLSNLLFLENLFSFLALEPRIVDPEKPAKAVEGGSPPDIVFEGVSFSYPTSSRPALDRLDLRVRGGSVAALLGANGSGKSTLIKLVCRLYDVQQGRILVGGRDVREVGIAELREMMTVLPQEPVHYSETVGLNVALGNLQAAPDPEQIDHAVRVAGAASLVARLPQGYETLLGPWFAGGVELSVGEWQRVALARAFVREAPVVLLDEPTASMDSWAEAAWVKRFRQVVRDRTVIIVTHRLATAMAADIIHVVERGRVVESGSHEELLQREGAYAEAWSSHVGSTHTRCRRGRTQRKDATTQR